MGLITKDRILAFVVLTPFFVLYLYLYHQSRQTTERNRQLIEKYEAEESKIMADHYRESIANDKNRFLIFMIGHFIIWSYA